MRGPCRRLAGSMGRDWSRTDGPGPGRRENAPGIGAAHGTGDGSGAIKEKDQRNYLPGPSLCFRFSVRLRPTGRPCFLRVPSRAAPVCMGSPWDQQRPPVTPARPPPMHTIPSWGKRGRGLCYPCPGAFARDNGAGCIAIRHFAHIFWPVNGSVRITGKRIVSRQDMCLDTY